MNNGHSASSTAKASNLSQTPATSVSAGLTANVLNLVSPSSSASNVEQAAALRQALAKLQQHNSVLGQSTSH